MKRTLAVSLVAATALSSLLVAQFKGVTVTPNEAR
jgi:hypothetical protein